MKKRLTWLITNQQWYYYVFGGVLICIGLLITLLSAFACGDGFVIGLAILGAGLVVIIIRRFFTIKIKIK